MSPFSDFEKLLLTKGFTERELKEIAFARLYEQDFQHGTDGHGRLILLAKFAELVEAMMNQLVIYETGK